MTRRWKPSSSYVVMTMPDGNLSDRLYFGVMNGREPNGLIPIDGSVSITEDEPFYGYSDCLNAMRLQPVTYTAHIDWARGADITKIFGIFPESPTPVTLMFEQERSHRALPRTVRDAKARRKGNRGNKRRRKVTERMRTTLPNVRVGYSGDFSDISLLM